jgi:hypothetical protein
MRHLLRSGLFAAAFLAGLLLRGSQAHVLILMASVMIAAPLALIMGVWLMIGLKRDAEVPVGLERLFQACITAVGCLLLSIASASAMRWFKVREAQTYVAEVMTLLEDYRSKHHHYPSVLSEIKASKAPSLIAYSSEGNGYYFIYRESFFLAEDKYFDGELQQWRRLDS